MYARRLIAGAMLLSSAACSTVRPISQPVPYIEANSPGQMWFTTSSGTQSMMMYRPKIVDDSIYGFDMRGQQMVLPKEIVQAATVKTLDKQRTFLVGAGATAVVGTGILLLAHNAAKTGVTNCTGSFGIVCNGKANQNENVRTSNGGVKIPINAAKVASGIARALLGSK